ncbi:hypothetical protein B9Z19DRAFT_1121616 [Tuber borchii]|uniref:Uncharacterized protein n=1 Tax=Tuber borchii TaxID=42251 RepID=A0A2T7A286_TUBBO|nr:hypothetical protein B9Z19DRAFT_1121616 [Tuber borchii]
MFLEKSGRNGKAIMGRNRDSRIIGDVKAGRQEEKDREEKGKGLSEGVFDFTSESEEEKDRQGIPNRSKESNSREIVTKWKKPSQNEIASSDSGQKEIVEKTQESGLQEVEASPASPAADWAVLAEEIPDSERDTAPPEP